MIWHGHKRKCVVLFTVWNTYRRIASFAVIVAASLREKIIRNREYRWMLQYSMLLEIFMYLCAHHHMLQLIDRLRRSCLWNRFRPQFYTPLCFSLLAVVVSPFLTRNNVWSLVSTKELRVCYKWFGLLLTAMCCLCRYACFFFKFYFGWCASLLSGETLAHWFLCSH